MTVGPASDRADRRARRFEREVRGDRRREHAALIDNETGIVLFRKRGDRTSVTFTDDELLLMRGNVLTHNHPAGWHYPETDPRRQGVGFSLDDVAILVEWGLAEIRAITPRFLYRLRPSPDPGSQFNTVVIHLHPSGLDYAIRTVFLNTMYDLERSIASGKITEVQAEAMLSHLALLTLVSTWGVEYQREEVP